MATLKISFPNGIVIEGNTIEEVTKLYQMTMNVKGTAESPKTPTESPLTDEEKAIIVKYKPTHRLGTDDGSIHKCLRECSYAFCGGKDKYDKKKYLRGKKAWFAEYTKEFREDLPEHI